MKLRELLWFYGGEVPELEVAGITCDSRKVQPGFVFVCIEGTVSDGHVYAGAAVGSGAAAVIAQRETGVKGEVIMDNTRRAWALMCAAWFGFPARRLRVVGITGTNGKSSASYALKHILERAGHKVGLIGTIQYMIGDEVIAATHTTPDAYTLQGILARMAAEGCGFAVMEASSQALDQHRVDGIGFEVGVFTNLTQDHLDYHGDMDAYMQAKRRLFTMCERAVLNADDPWSGRLVAGLTLPRLTYGVEGTTADLTARDAAPEGEGMRFTLEGLGHRTAAYTATAAMFAVYNALAAATAAVSLGIPFAPIGEALAQVPQVRGRAEPVPTGRDFRVVIDYAHTPDGLENICRALRMSGGRLVTLFGCGGDRDNAKRPLMGRIAAALSDLVIVTSDNPRGERPERIISEILEGMTDSKTPYTVIENRVEAIHWAIKHARPGDTVLLAGKGQETYQILADKTIHLDEREVVADALTARGEAEG